MRVRGGKTWKLLEPDPSEVEALARRHNLTRPAAMVLANRGIVRPEEVESFLSPSLRNLSDPLLLKDGEKAAERILSACERGERILIYADYDVDGATGGALLYLFLKEVFPDLDVSIHQNDRMLEGYGLKREHLKRAKEKGVSLVVTVDCGISDFEEVEEATSYGLDVIVTDHHTVKGDIPPAHAVLNPKRPDCSYPMRDLAGVGVVFVLVCVLRRMMRERGLFRGKSEPNLLRYLDLVAIGTVADIVPLLGDNRIYVRYGLEEIRRNPRPGVSALLDVAGVRREYFDEVDIGFRLGPRLNAAGRMGNSFLSSLILVEESPLRAMEMARLLAEQNTERQSVEGAILREAERALERIELEDRRTIVLWQEGWHPGVIGIVASRILERYGRPTIIFSLEGAEARGSARSLPGVNIMELLKRCERWIETYGGHAQAAGLVVRRSNLESFARALEEEARGIVRGEDLEREICIDGEVTLDELTERFFSEVSLLAPFGEGNQEPLFLARGAKIVNYEKKRNYTSFRVSQNGVVQDVISSFLPDGISAGDRVDILFSPRESGRGRGKLFLRDLTPS